MPKSFWVMLVIGFLGFVAMMVMMQVTVEKMASNSGLVQVISSLSKEYELDNVSVAIENTGDTSASSYLAMKIEYTTSRDSGFNISKQQEEMRNIGIRAIALYNNKDKESIATITITRKEVNGSGCFRETYTSAPLTIDNPNKRE